MKKNGSQPKVLIIGLDGLDPDFLDRHLDRLPALRAIRENGASGKLRSTVPPFSLTAWTSAMSGMNPGRTGLTCFPQDDFSDFGRPLNSRSVPVPLLWDVAGWNRKKVGVVNVPLTYPPSPVNGFMVSGFLTPSGVLDFTYPASLRRELGPDYETSFDFLQHEVKPGFFLKRLYRLTEKQFRTVENLIRKKSCDLFIYVISGTDWVQHYFLADPDLPDHADSEERVLKYFQYVDDFLGRVRAGLDDSTTLVILSDHGFGKVPSRCIYLNTWLRDNGYLRFRASRWGFFRKLIRVDLRALGKYRILGALKKRIPARFKTGFHRATRLRKEEIDWDRTSAYYSLFMQHTGYIRIPEKPGRSEQDHRKIKEELIFRLKELNRSREDTIFAGIYRREEIYRGGNLAGIPDIILIFEPRWLGLPAGGDRIFQDIPLGGRPRATHKMGGVFAFEGPGVIPGFRTDLKIIDVAPTVCALLSLPLPEKTDGRAARQCFRPGSGLRDKEFSYRKYRKVSKEPVSWKKEDQNNAAEKLRALGYL